MTQSVSRSPTHSPTNSVPPRMQQNINQNIQSHGVQNGNLSIPSGLPHVVSRRYPVHVLNQNNLNYYVQSNQQQNYTVHSVQSQQTQGFAVNTVGVNGQSNGLKSFHQGMYQMH
jgi:hypothetical protein